MLSEMEDISCRERLDKLSLFSRGKGDQGVA